MDINEYQRAACGTAIFPKDKSLMYLTLGVCGEAGEIAEKVKKHIRDNTSHQQLRESLILEIGDVMWYLSNLADAIHVDMAWILTENIEKIRSRMERNKLQGDGDNR